MHKRQLVIAWIILASWICAASAYIEDYPPYKFKDGPPKSLEVKPLVDLSSSGLEYVADRKSDSTLLEAYCVDLDGNGLKDFILFSNYRNLGVAGYEVYVEILLQKSGMVYQKISYTTIAIVPLKEFIDFKKDGRCEVIITGMHHSDKRGYLTYSIYEFKDYKLVNADASLEGFPKFVWAGEKPNDEDDAFLPKEQRAAHTNEKNNSIQYQEVRNN